MRGGIGSPYLYRWRVTLKGHSISWNLAADRQLFNRIQGQLYAEHRSMEHVPDALGYPAPGWEDDLTQTTWGALWERRRPSDAALAQLTIPVLSLTGQYDTCQIGTLEHFRRLERLGRADTRANNHLVIGPWDHVAWGRPDSEPAPMLKDIGPVGSSPINELMLAWFDHFLKGVNNPGNGASGTPRVDYFTMGANTWKTATNWPLPQTQWINYYLSGGGGIADRADSSRLYRQTDRVVLFGVVEDVIVQGSVDHE